MDHPPAGRPPPLRRPQLDRGRCSGVIRTPPSAPRFRHPSHPVARPAPSPNNLPVSDPRIYTFQLGSSSAPGHTPRAPRPGLSSRGPLALLLALCRALGMLVLGVLGIVLAIAILIILIPLALLVGLVTLLVLRFRAPSARRASARAASAHQSNSENTAEAAPPPPPGSINSAGRRVVTNYALNETQPDTQPDTPAAPHPADAPPAGHPSR